MSDVLLRDQGDLADTAEAAAARLEDIDAETLVKDYWVTQALRVIQDHFPGEFVFKGGTSLTKAVRCVDRFSEDIDLLIVGGESNSQRERLLKGIRDTVETDLQLEIDDQRGSTGKRRDVRYRFPSRLASRFEPIVRLEMGVRGEDDPPHQTYSIEPMLADAFARMDRDASEYADLASFHVPVLHPARTLWEKVVLTHSQVTDGTFVTAEPTRVGRHYGDIGALLALDDVRTVLVDAGERARIDASVRAVSEKWFGGEPPAVPDGGYAASPAFAPEPDLRAELAERYEAAVQNLWGPNGRLTFEQVLDRAQDDRELLDPTT